MNSTDYILEIAAQAKWRDINLHSVTVEYDYVCMVTVNGGQLTIRIGSPNNRMSDKAFHEKVVFYLDQITAK